MVNYTSAKSRTRAEEVAKKIQSLGPKALVCEASVANIKDIPKLVQSALELSETGKIEILIHKQVPSDDAALDSSVIFEIELTFPQQCRSRR